nr:flavodoxin [uncultured Holophaga sp.]
MNNKYIIAYYSRKGENYLDGRIIDLQTGNTALAAHTIQTLSGADLFEIKTLKTYPADYHETTEVAQRELEQNARPELAERLDSLADYEVIILGYPNWWGTMPMAVFTFLESHDFTGKTILPLCTHEGSGLGRSERDIQRLCPGAKVVKGLAVRGGSVQKAESQLAAWLKAAQVID